MQIEIEKHADAAIVVDVARGDEHVAIATDERHAKFAEVTRSGQLHLWPVPRASLFSRNTTVPSLRMSCRISNVLSVLPSPMRLVCGSSFPAVATNEAAPGRQG